ncbi:MAG: hypothetical protein R6V32_09670 [Bacteroidales bacterium]
MNNLRYITYCLVLFFLSINAVNAQFYIELNTGYATPVYYTGENKSYEKAYPHKYTYNDTSFTEYRKYNMGNGLSFGSTIGYKAKNGLTFGLDVFYLNNEDMNFLYNNFSHDRNMRYTWGLNEDRPEAYSKDEQYANYYSSRISLTPQVGYVFNIKNMFLEVFAGVSLSDVTVYRIFIGESEHLSHDYSNDPNDLIYYFRRIVKKSKYNKKLVSPSFGIKYSLPLFKNFSINSGVTVFPLLSFDRNEGLLYYVSDLEIRDDVETFQEWTDDRPDMVPQVGPLERFNLNSINISLGLRYTFGSTKNQGNDD